MYFHVNDFCVQDAAALPTITVRLLFEIIVVFHQNWATLSGSYIRALAESSLYTSRFNA